MVCNVVHVDGRFVELKPVMDVRKVLMVRRYPGYIYRRELTKCEGIKRLIEHVNCYSADTGEWIGSPKLARSLCIKRGLRKIQAVSGANICSIGFNPIEKKWYGWSHRAICGFGMGDKVFVEKFGDENTLFTQHGKTTITRMEQAKVAARRFAACVG